MSVDLGVIQFELRYEMKWRATNAAYCYRILVIIVRNKANGKKWIGKIEKTFFFIPLAVAKQIVKSLSTKHRIMATILRVICRQNL